MFFHHLVIWTAEFSEINWNILVFWKGYGVEEDEWRLAKDVKGVRQLVSEFHHRNPEAPQYISSSTLHPPIPPISNFTNTPDTVPSGCATGHCVSG